MQLDRETGLLMNLITDLEGKYKSEVEILSLTPFVTNLKAAVPGVTGGSVADDTTDEAIDSAP